MKNKSGAPQKHFGAGQNSFGAPQKHIRAEQNSFGAPRNPYKSLWGRSDPPYANGAPKCLLGALK